MALSPKQSPTLDLVISFPTSWKMYGCISLHHHSPNNEEDGRNLIDRQVRKSMEALTYHSILLSIWYTYMCGYINRPRLRGPSFCSQMEFFFLLSPPNTPSYVPRLQQDWLTEVLGFSRRKLAQASGAKLVVLFDAPYDDDTNQVGLFPSHNAQVYESYSSRIWQCV